MVVAELEPAQPRAVLEVPVVLVSSVAASGTSSSFRLPAHSQSSVALVVVSEPRMPMAVPEAFRRRHWKTSA
jgi:membrane protein YdbS with pleckstrin-like domain